MEAIPSSYHGGRLLGRSAGIKKVLELIDKAAKVDLPVLLVGETGTGKELAALEIHDRSSRREAPFVAVNMGALPAELIASELFGHVKGAFTGALHARLGRFAEAEGGTLFLDEITTMDERLQVALLRVLEVQCFRQVGGSRNIPTNVRVIAASNQNPREAVRKGRFRADLFHRLQVFRIHLPPLRMRRNDIRLLAAHFLDQFREEFAGEVSGISEEAVRFLRNYGWSGNVRELKNVIAQAAVMAEKGEIRPEHLPTRIARPPEGSDQAPPAPPETLPLPSHGVTTFPSDPSAQEILLPTGLSLAEVERAYILMSLAACGNNKTQTAKMLGISRKTLYSKLARWRIEV